MADIKAIKELPIEQISESMKKRNAEKYGNRDDDVIERSYRENKYGGDFYCAKNAEKYLRRFLSTGPKAGNPTDIKKALDYIVRMAEHNPEILTKEIVEKAPTKRISKKRS